jgi:MFS transporter, NNP family, nitrate/nitrite transporter
MKVLEKPSEAAVKPTQIVGIGGPTWLQQWQPESQEFDVVGRRVAWRTLAVTTFCLTIAFATWFMVSAFVVKLAGIGFKLDTGQLFWLTAMPGLAAGTLRIAHTFLIPVFGTRHTITVSTLLLAIPCIGWGIAVQNPNTPFWVLMVLAFLAGLGGGNFSSFMPSTSLFFPKRLQGTALGIQAGIGNFGVSVAQFVIPWIIGFSLLGSLGGSQNLKKGEATTSVWLQNAAYVWLPLIFVGAFLAWFYLRSVPLRASFKEQTDIFKNKHTWLMTSIYVMTFGSFSGFAAAFPLMTKQLYGGFEGAPDPLKYAFIGPLIGAGVRALFGPITDRCGGAKVTMVSALGLFVSALWASLYTRPTSVESFPMFLYAMLAVFLFAGIGNASTFKQMPMIFPPRQAGGVIGWTSAVAAYGPFLFSVLIGAVVAAYGNPTYFFYGAAVFYGLNALINWWFYTRRGAEKPC